MHHNPKKSQYMPMSNAPIRYSHGHSWECTTSHSICPCPMILSVTAMHGHSWECTTVPGSHSIIMPFSSLLCITLRACTCITMYFNPNYSWTFSLDVHLQAIINETLAQTYHINIALTNNIVVIADNTETNNYCTSMLGCVML